MSHTPPPEPCECCGKNWPRRPSARTETGPIHSECWDEHHSDPTGVWPPGHVCWADDDTPERRTFPPF